MSALSWRNAERWLPACAPHLALVLAAADLTRAAPPVAAVAALAVVLTLRRRVSRLVAAAAVAATLLALTCWAHEWVLSRDASARAALEAGRVLDEVGETHDRLIEVTQAAARAVSALPQARAALGGAASDRSALFGELETLARRWEEHPALALLAPGGETLAWAGRVVALSAPLAGGEQVFVHADSTTTTLVAAVPLVDATGRTVAFATAELTLAVRRRISNEFLDDFDRLVADPRRVQVRYHDPSAVPGELPAFPPAPAGSHVAVEALRTPGGAAVATVRATVPERGIEVRRTARRYRLAAALLACLALGAWMAQSPTVGRIAGGSTVLYAALFFLLRPPLPVRWSILSPDSYASPLLGPLLRHPAALLLTAAWILALAALALRSALQRPASRPTPIRLAVCALAALPVVWAAFAWIADTAARCTLDLENVALLPRAPAVLLVQVALVLLVAAASAALCAVFLLVLSHGDHVPRAVAIAAITAACLVIGLQAPVQGSAAAWFPVVPALLLLSLPAAFAARRRVWEPRLRASTVGTRAGLVLLAVAASSLTVHATLLHLGERSTRARIEREHAPSVLRQRAWREHVLREAQERIEALNVLEHQLPGPHPPAMEQLAFAIWSATDLAAFGFTSAIEVQDADGAVVSRFALNLPSLSAPTGELPRGEAWQVRRESVTVASARTNVLHASKLLRYHGDVHGAIHLYVGEDYWNLPYLTGRDPYSVLFRTAARGAQQRPVALLVYEGGVLTFSSAERPPVLDAAGLAELQQPRSPHWTRLTVDGIPHRAFVFEDEARLYVLAYPGRGAGRYAADLVEAVGGLTLLAAGALLAVMLARTLLGRGSLSFPSLFRVIERRFALRLFVAFTVLAAAPVGVLQLVVRSFVADHLRHETEDQALERATVAKKMVEDYAYLQQAGERPVTDPALVLVASFLRSDLDLFEGGRLVASSKRELYSSGLLPPRVPGPVFRALQLDGEPYTLRTETIGRFRYLVASVPVRLDPAETAILSIPLPLRQREVDSTIEDLDRTIRLASVLFLLAAAALAQSMARRISGPIRDLTEATQRVARGDMDARVTTTSRDELLRLVESFNRMAGDLAQQRRDLERSNRLAAWGEMARQVAHEVKNPLTPIQLSVEHLRRVWADGAPDFGATLETCTQTVLKQVRTLRGMVTEFSAFARPPAARLEEVDAGEVVAGLVAPYESALPARVTMAVQVEPSLPPVRVDRRLIERAIVNLVENALQALGDGGHIDIVVRTADERRRVEIEVRDTGTGLDPEVRDRIFEPFFSTKSTGSGLGLALVKKIAEDHGGGVSLQGEPGQGTQALLWLPSV